MINNDFVKMTDAMARDGGAGENCCLRLVGLEGMDEKVGRTDILDEKVARRHVQKWQWRWILFEVLVRRRRLRAEADPHGGEAEGILPEVLGKVGV